MKMLMMKFDAIAVCVEKSKKTVEASSADVAKLFGSCEGSLNTDCVSIGILRKEDFEMKKLPSSTVRASTSFSFDIDT